MWHEDILNLFVKTRKFIHIKFLNNILNATGAEANLRELKQLCQLKF